MIRLHRKMLLASAIAVNLAVNSEAKVYQWAVNGHFYQPVATAADITWTAARDAAFAAGGHLVTITSSEENDFVFSIISGDSTFWHQTASGIGPWIGGFKPASSSDPAAGWQWITGEPWSYTNWRPNPREPNNYLGNENRLHFIGTAQPTSRSPYWNDFADAGLPGAGVRSFIIEYDTATLYFGIGVNWSNVSDPGRNTVRGDMDVINLMNHLQAKLPMFSSPTVVILDAAASGAKNANTISTAFSQFTQIVGSGATVIFYVSSHGDLASSQFGLPDVEIPLAADGKSSLTAETMGAMLKSLPNSTRKIILLDLCHSGAIAAALASAVPNTSVIAASSAVGATGSWPSGLGIFTSALIAEIDAGVFDLNQIAQNINQDRVGTYASLLGQSVSLRDSGSATFVGLLPEAYERGDFSGNLLNSSKSLLQSSPAWSGALTAGGSFQLRLMNLPTNGFVSIQTSTDLISWLQIYFSAAGGTNLNYSFQTTNRASAFFRAKIIP